MIRERPIRILHVVKGLGPGGLETWLLRIVRNIDRQRFQLDFAVHRGRACAYDEEIRSLGSEIIPSVLPRNPLHYAKNLRGILREHGPYDVVHCHLHHFSGFVLRVASQAGVPSRIAHSHSDTLAQQTQSGFIRRSYLQWSKKCIQRFATAGIAVSPRAAAALFGDVWDQDSRWNLLSCGIDVTPYASAPDPAKVRRELNIPDDAFVMGHVGVFREPKNHDFLIDVLAEVAGRRPNVRLLLIGDGPLRPAIEDKIGRLNLRDKVVFAEIRTDVVPLLQGAVDVFVFPSLWEGLPLALLEAQAAGLPCVASDAVPPEAQVTPFVQRLPLSRPVADWADVVLAPPDGSATERRSIALSAFTNSHFNICASVEALQDLYVEQRSLYFAG